jgi:hypothetical protein
MACQKDELKKGKIESPVFFRTLLHWKISGTYLSCQHLAHCTQQIYTISKSTNKKKIAEWLEHWQQSCWQQQPWQPLPRLESGTSLKVTN